MDKAEKKTKEKISEKEPIVVKNPFKGKYESTIGRRKTSLARVRVYKNGQGVIMVNDKKINEYFPAGSLLVVKQPLKLTGNLNSLNISVVVKGGGTKCQAEAIRHGIARSLVIIDENFKNSLKAKGWLKRDSRRKERKKPGLKKARRAPQWSKR